MLGGPVRINQDFLNLGAVTVPAIKTYRNIFYTNWPAELLNLSSVSVTRINLS